MANKMLLIVVDGCLVPLACGLMNGWCGFSSHGGGGGGGDPIKGLAAKSGSPWISQALNFHHGHVFLKEFFSRLVTDNKRFIVSSFCY